MDVLGCGFPRTPYVHTSNEVRTLQMLVSLTLDKKKNLELGRIVSVDAQCQWGGNEWCLLMSLGTSPSCPYHPLCERTLVHLGSHLVTPASIGLITSNLTVKTHLQPPVCALLWRVSQCSLLLGGLACNSSDHPGPCTHMAIAETCYHVSNLKKLLCFFLISIFPALRPTTLASSSGLCRFESFVLLTVVCLCCSLWTPELTFSSTPSFKGPYVLRVEEIH